MPSGAGLGAHNRTAALKFKFQALSLVWLHHGIAVSRQTHEHEQRHHRQNKQQG